MTETVLKNLLREGSSCSVGVTLSEWSAGILDATKDVALRMSRGGGVPLTELFQFVDGEKAL